MPRRQMPEGKPFKKGQSGNPNGRPKGSIAFNKRIDQMLREAVKDKNGESLEMADVIVKSLIKQAAMGNMKAIEYLIDKIDGKEVQKHEFESTQNIVIDDSHLKKIALAVADEIE